MSKIEEICQQILNFLQLSPQPVQPKPSASKTLKQEGIPQLAEDWFVEDWLQFEEVRKQILNTPNVISHNWRRKQLRALPPEIGQLKFLQTLDLSINKLTEMPPKLGNCKTCKRSI